MSWRESFAVSKAEILAELPKLTAEDRILVFERLCELQEKDLLQGIGPNAEERKPLDAVLSSAMGIRAGPGVEIFQSRRAPRNS